MTRPSRLLPGTPLLGFAIHFDASRGDPKTPWPYVTVVPSAVGCALLPFLCPHCGGDCGALVDPARRRNYYDRLRKFSWCPTCRKRFFVDRKGKPLSEALPAGAKVAPASVERAGELPATPSLKALPAAGEVSEDGLDVLGADLAS